MSQNVTADNISLSGGVNTRTAGRMLAENEATELVNIDISQPGLRFKRLAPLDMVTLTPGQQVELTCPVGDVTLPVSIQWNGLAGPQTYYVQVYSGTGCSGTLLYTSAQFTVVDFETVGFTIPNSVFTTIPGVYSVHVVSVGSGGNSDVVSNCCTLSFDSDTCTGATLPPPILLSPINGASVTTNPVYFSWTNVPNATGYILRIYLEGTTTLVHQSSILNPATFAYSVSLTVGEDYDWTVQTIGNGVNTCNSDEQATPGNFTYDCTIGISPSSATFDASGGAGSVTITANNPGCPWAFTSDQSWLTITGSASGAGSGTLNYAVAINTGSLRTGHLTETGGAVHTVTQSAGVDPCDGIAGKRYRVKNGLSVVFTSLGGCGTQGGSIQYDLTMPDAHTGTCSVDNYAVDTTYYVVGNNGGGDMHFQMASPGANLSHSGSTWTLTIPGNGAGTWEGTFTSAGALPPGVYTRTGGCAGGPSTLEVEEY